MSGSIYLTNAEIDVLWSNVSTLISTGRATVSRDPIDVDILGKSERTILKAIERKLDKIAE